MNPLHHAIFNGADGSFTFQASVVDLAFGGKFYDGVIDLVFHRKLLFGIYADAGGLQEERSRLAEDPPTDSTKAH